ncbi:MAG: aminopeptidase [Thermoplasmata archaeon]|nr:aminopeptidase [Thermoplasmata archaeon]
MTLAEGARRTVRTCLNVKRGEYVLVLVDTPRREIGVALYEEALKAGAETVLAETPPRSRHGDEPPQPIAGLMRDVDVVIAATEYSISHTLARRKATESGTRIATMPTITADMMSAGGMTADFREVSRLAARMIRRLSRCRELSLTSALGTDLAISLGRRKWIIDTGIIHRRGDFGNLPAGEVFIAPVEGKSNGKVLIDGAFGGIGKLDRPITITVEDGRAIRISGGKAANELRSILARQERKVDDPDAPYNIAEFGIGLNPKARIIGNPLEDEKVMGTVHIALGDNSTFGGKVKAGIHLDGILTSPTLRSGEQVLIEAGVHR